jgi:flagellar biosynthesis protein FlhG
VASGKGGTGKSVVSASLARIFAQRGRTLVVDADMGVGNAHLLQDVTPGASFVDVVQGRCSVRESVTPCTPELDLLSAGSGVSRMAGLSPYELHLIARGLEELEQEYDFLVVDSAAGLSEQTVGFAAASDAVLVVTTPDLTAMTDAYAFLKVLLLKRPDCVPLLLVNRTLERAECERHGDGDRSGAHVADRIRSVCSKFLGREPRWVGSVPEDPAVLASVTARKPVVVERPGSPAALALQALAVPVLDELAGLSRDGPGPGLGKSLMEHVGFARKSG